MSCLHIVIPTGLKDTSFFSMVFFGFNLYVCSVIFHTKLSEFSLWKFHSANSLNKWPVNYRTGVKMGLSIEAPLLLQRLYMWVKREKYT